MNEPVELTRNPVGRRADDRRGAVRDDSLELTLRVDDPEVLAALREQPSERERRRYAALALRIGVLALRQADGRLDGDTLRVESERLLEDLERRLEGHRAQVTAQLGDTLKTYFDPGDGRFAERVERLVRRDGELEQLMRRQIGGDDSTLARTLAASLGRDSALMRRLDPEAGDGLVGAIAATVATSLGEQRKRLLDEFSLDNRDGALGRLVRELDERHGSLQRAMRERIDEVVKEFSLDDDSSALSRLVKQVDGAQQRISAEFSLDERESALARLKRELLDVLELHRKSGQQFQTEVRESLAALSARREASLRSTRHGDDFEAELFRAVAERSQRVGDTIEHTGNTTGQIPHCKVGDIVVELGPDARGAGARFVIEAKQKAGYSVTEALRELDRARKNRRASIGLFVFSASHAPEATEPLRRYGSDVVAVWDAEDPASDVYLDAALTIVRALATRDRTSRDERSDDLDAIDRAVRRIEKQSAGLDSIVTSAQTVRSGGEKILERATLIRKTLLDQVRILDESRDALETALDRDDDRV